MNNGIELTRQTRRIVETLYACGARGDMPGALSVVDEAVVVHEPSFLPHGGTYKGIDAFVQLFATITQHHMDFSRLAIQRLVVEGERSFAVVHAPAYKGGTAVFAEEMLVRNGKIVDIWLYFHDPVAMTVR